MYSREYTKEKHRGMYSQEHKLGMSHDLYKKIIKNESGLVTLLLTGKELEDEIYSDLLKIYGFSGKGEMRIASDKTEAMIPFFSTTGFMWKKLLNNVSLKDFKHVVNVFERLSLNENMMFKTAYIKAHLLNLLSDESSVIDKNKEKIKIICASSILNNQNNSCDKNFSEFISRDYSEALGDNTPIGKIMLSLSMHNRPDNIAYFFDLKEKHLKYAIKNMMSEEYKTDTSLHSFLPDLADKSGNLNLMYSGYYRLVKDEEIDISKINKEDWVKKFSIDFTIKLYGSCKDKCKNKTNLSKIINFMMSDEYENNTLLHSYPEKLLNVEGNVIFKELQLHKLVSDDSIKLDKINKENWIKKFAPDFTIRLYLAYENEHKNKHILAEMINHYGNDEKIKKMLLTVISGASSENLKRVGADFYGSIGKIKESDIADFIKNDVLGCDGYDITQGLFKGDLSQKLSLKRFENNGHGDNDKKTMHENMTVLLGVMRVICEKEKLHGLIESSGSNVYERKRI